MTDLYALKKPSLFIVRTTVGDDATELNETLVWAHRVEVHEISGRDSPITVIQADHVRIMVSGCFVENEKRDDVHHIG